MTRVWDNMNRGVWKPPFRPAELTAPIHEIQRLTNTQRQWKDIKQKYLEGAEEEE